MNQPPSPHRTFASRLRSLRREAGFSQEALAEAAGLSVNAISALERGTRRQPFPDTVKRLADALGLEGDARRGLMGIDQEPVVSSTAPASPRLMTNIRRDPTSFVGRERELARLHAFLADAPQLLTLTGPGGVGKTRLAQEFALAELPSFTHGAWFVDLAPVQDADRARAVLVEQLEPLFGARVPHDRLARALAELQCLIVLDNVEQIPDFPDLMTELLAVASMVRFVVTSRGPLRLRAEQVVPIEPLALQEENAEGGDETGLAAAVALFHDRARTHDPGFVLTTEEIGMVTGICRLAGGLPLAIELAAARVPVLPLSFLLARLQEGIDPLSRASRDVPERQQTMRKTIDWSVRSLDPTRRDVFAMLSVFQGGSTWDAAEELYRAVAPNSPIAFLDIVSDLVDAGLVVTDRGEAEPRIRMLAPIHAHAGEILLGEARSHTRHRHAELYWRVAITKESPRFGQRLHDWRRQLLAEQHNLEAAIATFAGAGRHDEAVDILWSMWRFWWLAGLQRSALRWLRQIIAEAGDHLDPVHRGRALIACGSFIWATGNDSDAVEGVERAVAIAGEVSDGRALAIGQTLLGLSAIRAGDLEAAESRFALAREDEQALADPWLDAWTLAYQGVVAMLQKRFGAATERLHASLELARAEGDTAAMAETLFYVGVLAAVRSQPAVAAGHLAAGLEAAELVGEPILISFYLRAIARRFVSDAVMAARLEAVATEVLADRGGPWYMDHIVQLLGREVAQPDDQPGAVTWTLIEAARRARDEAGKVSS